MTIQNKKNPDIGIKKVALSVAALAFLGSAVNAVFIILAGIGVSHMSGDLSRFGTNMESNSLNLTSLKMLFGVMFAFGSGAFFSGFAMQHRRFTTTSPYGRGLIFVGLTFLMSYSLLPGHILAAAMISSFGLGFQNALAPWYRGIVIRTTHITGILTDLGHRLGMRLAGRHDVPMDVLSINLIILIMFLVGSASGAWMYFRAGVRVLEYIGITYIFLGAVYYLSIFRRLRAGETC